MRATVNIECESKQELQDLCTILAPWGTKAELSVTEEKPKKRRGRPKKEKPVEPEPAPVEETAEEPTDVEPAAETLDAAGLRAICIEVQKAKDAVEPGSGASFIKAALQDYQVAKLSDLSEDMYADFAQFIQQD